MSIPFSSSPPAKRSATARPVVSIINDPESPLVLNSKRSNAHALGFHQLGKLHKRLISRKLNSPHGKERSRVCRAAGTPGPGRPQPRSKLRVVDLYTGLPLLLYLGTIPGVSWNHPGPGTAKSSLFKLLERSKMGPVFNAKEGHIWFIFLANQHCPFRIRNISQPAEGQRLASVAERT